jgi:hypothetical protein
MKLRWGTLSCQRAVLESRHGLLRVVDEHDKGSSLSPRFVSRSVVPLELDGREYLVILSDESARADLNVLMEVATQLQVEELARRFLDRMELVVELKPLIADQIEFSPVFPALQSWDQVLKTNQGQFLSPDQILRETKDLTLWGGKLNIQSASDEVLRETIKLAAGAIVAERLVSLRESERELSLETLIQRLSLTENQRNRLNRVLSNQSSAQSVGVISVDGNRIQYSLLIRKVFAGSVVRFYSFTW